MEGRKHAPEQHKKLWNNKEHQKGGFERGVCCADLVWKSRIFRTLILLCSRQESSIQRLDTGLFMVAGKFGDDLFKVH
jgi:hypothetical protein